MTVRDRVLCPVCGYLVSVRRNGMIRAHQDHRFPAEQIARDGAPVCQTSGTLAPENLAAKLLESLKRGDS